MWRRMRFRRRLPKPNLLAVAPYSGQIQHCTAYSRVDASGACRPMACARSTDLSRSRTPSDTWPADVLQSNWRIQTCDTGSMGVPRRYQGRPVRQGRRTKCKCCSRARSCRFLGSGGGIRNVVLFQEVREIYNLLYLASRRDNREPMLLRNAATVSPPLHGSHRQPECVRGFR